MRIDHRQKWKPTTTTSSSSSTGTEDLYTTCKCNGTTPTLLHEIRRRKKVFYYAWPYINYSEIDLEDRKTLYPLSPQPIVGEKGNIAMLSFTGTDLSEQTSLDLPEDWIRNWLTCVSPATKGEHGVISPLHLSKIIATCDNINELASGETWIWMSHSALLTFWGTSHPADGLMHNSTKLLQHMSNYCPLAVLCVRLIRDNIFIKEIQ